jgi:hypothetical protein
MMTIPDNDARRNKVCPICGIAFRDRSQVVNMTYCGSTACDERRRALQGARIRHLYKTDPHRPRCAWCGVPYAEPGSRYCTKCTPVASRAARATVLSSQRQPIGSTLGAEQFVRST